MPPPLSLATLLPAVRDILPLTDRDALNRTLCDVLETALTVPPAPVHAAIAVPALTPQEFLFSTLLDGPQPATAVERVAREQHGWSPQVLFKARQRLRGTGIVASQYANAGLHRREHDPVGPARRRSG
jgi:hypothetical protein